MESIAENSFLNNFSACLRALMKERALTQSQVADLCGVSQPTVQRWLQRKMPQAYDIYLLSGVFGMKPGTFLDLLEKNADKLNAEGIEVELIPPDLEFVKRERDTWRDQALKWKFELDELKEKMRALLGSEPPRQTVSVKDTTLRNSPKAPASGRRIDLKSNPKANAAANVGLKRAIETVESKPR